MVWNLSVIISYLDGSWESAELVFDDKGGYRSFGPDVSTLDQVKDLIARLGLTPSSGTFYRSDISDVTLRFTTTATNGYIYIAGATEDVLQTNNAGGIQTALENEPNFVNNLLQNLRLFMLDYDHGSALLPLYVEDSILKVGSVWRDYDIITNFLSRWSAIAQDLDGTYWVVNVSGDSGEGFLRQLDSDLSVIASYPLSEALHDNEAIKLIAYDANTFLLVQEDENVYYLSKTGVLTSIYNLSQSDPLSLFRHNNEIFMLMESNYDVRKWNPSTERFEIIGSVTFSDGYTDSLFDIVGTVYDEASGEYVVFTNRADGWHYSLLNADTLVITPLFEVYGIDDDIMLIMLPVSVNNTGIGYASENDRFKKAFYTESEGIISTIINIGYVTEDKMNVGSLEVQIDPGSGFVSIPTLSVTIGPNSILITADMQTGSYGDPVRIRYTSDTSGRYLYVAPD